MNNLKLSIEPGFYPEAQTATWDIEGDVSYIVFNQGGTPPAISEYIAYDTLVPANPFIAVTQDGRGNVVYDGGFPKFYNLNNNISWTTFNQLSASFKFLHNALKWAANPDKVAAGNNKVLFLGDANYGESYCVKGIDNTGFYSSFSTICQIAGFVPTFKVRSDYGLALDPRLAELEQYCAVVVMSSVWVTSGLITDQACSDLATFRNQGSGLILITDHGQIVNSLAEASALTVASGFATGNKIAARFGAYFSGDYNRSPVNVGYIRQTYGDHPLYAGMDNADSIDAGGSESKVVVATFTKYFPGSLPAVTINRPGVNTVQAAAKFADGSIETYRGLFVINEGSVIAFVDEDGEEITEQNIGYSNKFPTLRFETDFGDIGTVVGTLSLNSTRIADFTVTLEAGMVINWLAGRPGNLKVNNNDMVHAVVTQPFSYSSSLKLLRNQPQVNGQLSTAELSKSAFSIAARPMEMPLTAMFDRIRQATGDQSKRAGLANAENVVKLKLFFDR